MSVPDATSAASKPTSTSRVPLPIGIRGPRVRSSTGMVIRSGRPADPWSRFQSATVRAVATISWSFTV